MSVTRIIILLALSTCILSNCISSSFFMPHLNIAHFFPSKEINHPAFWQSRFFTIWATLQQTSARKLIALQNQTHETDRKAWLQLALIHKHNNIHTTQFIHELLEWRKYYVSHPGTQLFPNNTTLSTLLNSHPPQHIAVLIPLNGPYAQAGKIIRDGILKAYYAHLPTLNNQSITFYDTTQNQNIESLYQQVIQDGADFIIGPLVKNVVERLLSRTHHFPITTLALNYTEKSFGAFYGQFFQFGLSPNDEIACMVHHAQKMGYQHAIIIAAQTKYSQNLVNLLSNYWKNNKNTIQDIFYYTPQTHLATALAQLLKVNTPANTTKIIPIQKENSKGQDLIFLLASAKEARIIIPLLHYYADTLPIYATASVRLRHSNIIEDMDLNGVTLCDMQEESTVTTSYFRTHTQAEVLDRLYAVGQDAYLLSQTLAILINIPYFSLYGKTGALIISPRQQIHRLLPCKTIHYEHL